jgi:hypothetical protein
MMVVLMGLHLWLGCADAGWHEAGLLGVARQLERLPPPQPEALSYGRRAVQVRPTTLCVDEMMMMMMMMMRGTGCWLLAAADVEEDEDRKSDDNDGGDPCSPAGSFVNKTRSGPAQPEPRSL